MANGTVITLGGVELDQTEIRLPFYLGATPRETVVRVSARLAEDLKALPRDVSLSIFTSEEDNSAAPAHGLQVFSNLRLLEVRELNDKVCEVVLSDVRDDLARLVCPADFNLLWGDGYLDGTVKPNVQDAVGYLAGLVPALQSALSFGAFDRVSGADTRLPDGMFTSGLSLCRALDILADAVGADWATNDSGYLYLAPRAGQAGVDVSAYNWAEAYEPSWALKSRTVKGLPHAIRVYYPEKHALLLRPIDEQATRPADALRLEFEWVYAYGDTYLTLPELLSAFGFSPTDISESLLNHVVMTENFEGTLLEPKGDYDTNSIQIIGIIKRDYRQLARLVYPDNIGRRGGWTDLQFGYFVEVTDKDGNTRWTDDVHGRGVQAEWVEWLAKAEANMLEPATIEGCVVARSHVMADGDAHPPDSPFVAEWVNEQAGVFRVAPNLREGQAQAAWLGTLTPEPELRVTREDVAIDDQGNPVGNIAGLHFPTVADVKFQDDFSMEVYAVGVRRLPNTRERWTAIELEGFPGGGVDLFELEVSDDLFAVRGPDDNFAGPLLNEEALRADAARRVAAVKARLAAELGGTGRALGAQAAAEVRLGSGVQEVAVVVDGTVVMTEIVVGPAEDVEAQQRRADRRAASRRLQHAGKAVV